MYAVKIHGVKQTGGKILRRYEEYLPSIGKIVNFISKSFAELHGDICAVVVMDGTRVMCTIAGADLYRMHDAWSKNGVRGINALVSAGSRSIFKFD